MVRKLLFNFLYQYHALRNPDSFLQNEIGALEVICSSTGKVWALISEKTHYWLQFVWTTNASFIFELLHLLNWRICTDWDKNNFISIDFTIIYINLSVWDVKRSQNIEKISTYSNRVRYRETIADSKVGFAYRNSQLYRVSFSVSSNFLPSKDNPEWGEVLFYHLLEVLTIFQKYSTIFSRKGVLWH